MKPSDVDREWLVAHLDMLGQVARDGFEAVGRGAVVVDLQENDETEPIYIRIASMTEGDDEYTHRLVREYAPAGEFVVVLIRPGEMESTYRIALP